MSKNMLAWTFAIFNLTKVDQHSAVKLPDIKKQSGPTYTISLDWFLHTLEYSYYVWTQSLSEYSKVNNSEDEKTSENDNFKRYKNHDHQKNVDHNDNNNVTKTKKAQTTNATSTTTLTIYTW